MCASARRFSASGECAPASFLPDDDLRLRSEPSQKVTHGGDRHRNAAGCRRKILTRQMHEYGAAKARNSRRKIMIDLDDEIVKVVGAPEPIAALLTAKPDRTVVMTAVRVLAPGVFRSNRADRQQRPGSRVAVSAPPQSPRPKNTSRRAAVALPVVGDDAAAPQRDRDGLSTGHKPTAAAVAGGSADPDCRERAITSFCSISH